MPYASLREFITRLEVAGRMVQVSAPVSPFLEMTEIQTRLLAEGGPAVLFENVVYPGGVHAGVHPGGRMPVLINLFGTVERAERRLRELIDTGTALPEPSHQVQAPRPRAARPVREPEPGRPTKPSIRVIE